MVGGNIMTNGRKKVKKAGLKAGLINSINNRIFGKNENFAFWKILDFWKIWKKIIIFIIITTIYHY